MSCCTCRPVGLPSCYPDSGVVIYVGNKGANQKFTPIWFIFDLQNRESVCIYLIQFFFPQGWAGFILHLFSGMCRKPYNAIWRQCVAEIASREFSFMLYPKMLMWLFTTLPSFIKRNLCSCGVLWMWLAEQTSGKFAGVKQIAALEKIQTAWEWHSVLFSVEKL